MKAGRELDALIAEKVMNWERENESWYDEEGIEGTRFTSSDGIELTAYGWGKDCEYDELDDRLPHYSTNIADAWLVVEYFISQEWENGTPKYLIDFEMVKDNYFVHIEENQLLGDFWEEEAETAPLAICLTALKAVGYEIED